jgi:hypothetical protein
MPSFSVRLMTGFLHVGELLLAFFCGLGQSHFALWSCEPTPTVLSVVKPGSVLVLDVDRVGRFSRVGAGRVNTDEPTDERRRWRGPALAVPVFETVLLAVGRD